MLSRAHSTERYWCKALALLFKGESAGVIWVMKSQAWIGGARSGIDVCTASSDRIEGFELELFVLGLRDNILVLSRFATYTFRLAARSGLRIVLSATAKMMKPEFSRL